jgi:ABC-type iron transport system FetAB ATPase subunit
MTALLRMQGIAKAFGAVSALHDASLEVAAGEAHALLGANGAGKSTLMNVLGGLVPRDAGRILIDDKDVEIGSPAEAGALGIRFVQQELNMLPSMTVAENVLIDDFPTRGWRIDRRAARTRVSALLARLQCSFGPDDPVEGKCIELQGSLTDINAVNRSKAWHEVTDKSGVITTLESVPTEWNPDKYRSGTVNAFRAHPEANCMFLASDFAWPAVQSALESVGRLAKTGDPKHVWIATQDLFPEAVKAMEQHYIDLGTIYDAYGHAKEAIRVAILILKGEKIDCPDNICLVKGRLAMEQNIDTLENLWSRPAK